MVTKTNSQLAEVTAFNNRLQQLKREANKGSLKSYEPTDQDTIKKILKEVLRAHPGTAETFGNFTKGALGLLYPHKDKQRSLKCQTAKALFFIVFVQLPAKNSADATWAKLTFSAVVRQPFSIEWL